MLPINHTVGWLADHPEFLILAALVLMAIAILSARRTEA